MPLKSFSHRPLYREVVREALLAAFRKRFLWPFAFFAAILQTGGIYDVLLSFYKNMASYALLFTDTMPLARLTAGLPNNPFASFDLFLGSLLSYERFVFYTLVVASIFAFSFIAQGALVAGLAASRARASLSSYRVFLAEGARRLWLIGGLNIITLLALWLAKVLVAVPVLWYSLAPSWLSFLCAAITLFLSAVIGIVIITVHVFALNAMVREDFSLLAALRHGLFVWRKHWLVILETALLLLVVGIGILLAFTILFFVMAAPWLFLLMVAFTLGWPNALLAAYSLLLLLMVVLGIFAGMITVTFNFAVWSGLYRRVGEGSASSRLHRWLRLALRFLHHSSSLV